MDNNYENINECVFPNEQIDYNQFSPNIKGVGDFKDIDLNENNKENIYDKSLEEIGTSNYININYPGFQNINENQENYISNEVYGPPDSCYEEENDTLTKNNKWIISIAFFLCFLSNFIGHLIREPLFTTKVNIQKTFGSTTLQLSYLDVSYLAFYSIGQFITPIVIPRKHIIIFASFWHFILGISHFLLVIFENLGGFIFVYGITGFLCAILWLSLYNDLHSWLPLNSRLLMLTFWCCAAELGLISGTIMCAHIQTDIVWRVLFVITSLSNLITSLLLFTCYIKPRQNQEYSESLDVYIPRVRFFDPLNIGKENAKKIYEGIKKVYMGTPVQLELDTLPTNTVDIEQMSRMGIYKRYFERLYEFLTKKATKFFKNTGKGITKVVRGHVDVLKRVKYLNFYTLGYSSLRSSRNCFAFWISFYLITELKYSIQEGIYATLVFQMGSCFGSVIGGFLSKMVLKDLHLISCSLSSLFSLLSISSIYFIDMNRKWKCYLYVLIVGLASNCTELLITTRGLKSLCQQSMNQEQKDYSVSLGTTFSISTFLSVFQGYISIYIAHHFGWNTMFLYLSLMMLLSTGALSVPSRREFQKINPEIL